MEEAFGDETRQLSRQCVQHRWDRVAKGFVWSGPGPPASMKPTSLGRQIFDPGNIMERLSEVERPLASDFLFHAAAAMVMHLSYNNMRRHCSPTGRYRASLSQDHAGCSALRLQEVSPTNHAWIPASSDPAPARGWLYMPIYLGIMFCRNDTAHAATMTTW